MVGTDAGVDRRLPAAAELEVPFYEGMRLGVPGLPDLVETLAEGRYDLAPRHRARPGRGRRHPAQPRRRPAAPRQLPHRAGRLRAACAAATAAWRRWPSAALGAFYGAPSVVLSPSPAADRSLLRLGVDPAADRPLGARRRHLALRPGQGRSRRLPRRAEGPLRRPPHPREGGRPARRELPAGAPLRPPPAPAARRRRAGGGGVAGAARRARHLPRLAGGRGPGARLRQRRRLPLLQPHRHLRPGRSSRRARAGCRWSPSPRAARRR